MRCSNYTPEEDAIIKANFRTKTYKEISQMINRSPEAIRSHVKDTLKLSRTPEEIKEMNRKHAMKTFYKVGHTPSNTLHDGAERVRADRSGRPYLWCRIGRSKWERKQVLNWVAKHGPIPKTHVLVCRTSETLNCDPSNWELITKAENLARNRKKALNNTYKRTCAVCGKSFDAKATVQKYCSSECYLSTLRKEPVEREATCKNCGKTFTTTDHRVKHCSDACRRAYSRPEKVVRPKAEPKPRTKVCISCGNDFEPNGGYQKKCNDCRFPIKEVPIKHQAYQEKKCTWCGDKFTPTHSHQKKCKSCQQKRTKHNAVKQPLQPINCAVCGVPFTPTRINQIKCKAHRHVRVNQLRAISGHQDKPATRTVTSVVINQAPAEKKVEKQKVLESPNLGAMEFKFYDKKLRRMFFFKTREKYDAFLKRNHLKYADI